MTSPLTPSLSPAFAEAASRRQAPGEREIYRGINLNPLPLGDCRNSGEAKKSGIGGRRADKKALERNLLTVRFRTSNATKTLH